MKAEERLKELGLTLPPPPKPVGSYIPVSISGNMLYTSGIIPLENGKLNYKGRFPSDFSIEQGQSMANICVLNALSAIKDCISSLNKISKIIKLNGFIRCDRDFYDQPKVLNGASDLLIKIFGEKGHHARSAIGVPDLPLGSPIELELIMELL